MEKKPPPNWFPVEFLALGDVASSMVGVDGAAIEVDNLLGGCAADAERTRLCDIMFPDGLMTAFGGKDGMDFMDTGESTMGVSPVFESPFCGVSGVPVAISGKGVGLPGGVFGRLSAAGVVRCGGVGTGGGSSRGLLPLFDERLDFRDLKRPFPLLPLFVLFVLFLLSVDLIDERSGLALRLLEEPKTPRSLRPVETLEVLLLRSGAARVADRLDRFRGSEAFSELAIELLSLETDSRCISD